MKVLILTCKTGQGHNSSAAAIKESFDKRGIECDIQDNAAMMSKLGAILMDKAFTGVYLYMPKFFNKGYSMTEFRIGRICSADMFASALMLFSRRLRRYITENGYTHVIAVHLLSAVMISAMNKKKTLGVKTAFLSTDYTLLPFISNTELDLYLMPHEDLADLYVDKGIPREKHAYTGIPVRRDFTEYSGSREEARRELDLPTDSKVAFIMGGSMGCGPIEELVETIAKSKDENLRILVCCGTNKQLLKSLEKSEDVRIRAFSYSNNIPTILRATDVFVTKPGGISITEAGVMGVPTVLLNAIGGCETPNFNFFTSHGFAFGASDISDVAKHCNAVLTNEEAGKEKREKLNTAFAKSSADEIANAVIELGE